jgi:hypothetical protein
MELPAMIDQHPGPVQVPLRRADFYPHGTIETPVLELDVRYAFVGVNVIDADTVTLTMSRDVPDPRPEDVELPYDHVEFDLDPAAARKLAIELLAAADRLGPAQGPVVAA